MSLKDLEQVSPASWYYDVRDQLKWHIYRRSEEAFAAAAVLRESLRTPEDLRARQAEVRRGFLDSIGGLPPMDTPLQPESRGAAPGPGCTIERIIFQSRPRHYVTANLYLPDGLTGLTGAVLFLCGHHLAAKHAPEYQAVCQTLCQAGLVVLAQDPPGQGERLDYGPADNNPVGWGTVEHDYAGAQCLAAGDAIARYFLHDAIRGIDYLQSRPEVDPQRIGVTGNSGGGTQTCLVMLADPRIAAAAPATFIMSRQSYLWAGGPQDAEQIWPGFTARGCDHAEVLLCMAPRPVRVLAVTSDFFPIEGTRATVQTAKRFWELAGHPDGLDLVEDHSTHRYTLPLARAAGRFFRKHLLGRDDEPAWREPAPLEEARLWCVESGQVRGEIPGVLGVADANRSRVEDLAVLRESLPPDERRSSALAWLRARVEAQRQPCELNPRFYHQFTWDGIAVESAFWWSQEGLFNHGRLFRPGAALPTTPVTLAVWDGGSGSLEAHAAWIRETCQAGRAVLVLDVSGAGVIPPRPLNDQPLDQFHSTIHKFATDLLWLDDDLAALRTFDVLRALDIIAAWPGLESEGVEVYASGVYGIYGRLAAALDPRIGRLDVADGIPSIASWAGARLYDSRDTYSALLRGALHHFDLPELPGRE